MHYSRGTNVIQITVLKQKTEKMIDNKCPGQAEVKHEGTTTDLVYQP